MNEQKELFKILDGDDLGQIREVFSFDKNTDTEVVLYKFNLWIRYFLPKYFEKKGSEPVDYYDDAPYHKDIDFYNLKCYREPFTFVDIVFRGGAKTARTKLFLAYAIANDRDHFRKYLKILSADDKNVKQIVTDIYNIFIFPEYQKIYPEIFAKTNAKREETMSSFTTATGVKIVAETIGVSHRGALQEESRPDLTVYDDIENRKTLRSAITTHTIWENMEEARLALSINGSSIYNCNYVSEAGNVHKLVTKKHDKKKVLIVPIIDDKGVIAWASRFSLHDIEEMKKVDDDFEGEKLCSPAATKDIFFDRANVEKQIPIKPIKVISGFKIFKEFELGHFYASGHDVGGGVGLDSSTSVFIDFSTFPAEVVATYADNTIKPDMFGYEIKRQAGMFGDCLVAPERNYGDSCITILKQLKANIYRTQPKANKIMLNPPTEYGWRTNDKDDMLFSLADAINKGLLLLNDEDLKNEVKGYTRNDLLENVRDPRLVTRHFDLLIACCIAWKMKSYRYNHNHQPTARVVRPKIIRQV